MKYATDMIMRWLAKKRTPDQELAKAVRDAAKAYNDAVRKAKNAGLTVSACARSEWEAFGGTYISDQTVHPTISKHTSTRL
jgi:methionine synthase II (cobalamin-independent)